MLLIDHTLLMNIMGHMVVVPRCSSTMLLLIVDLLLVRLLRMLYSYLSTALLGSHHLLLIWRVLLICRTCDTLRYIEGLPLRRILILWNHIRLMLLLLVLQMMLTFDKVLILLHLDRLMRLLVVWIVHDLMLLLRCLLRRHT